MRHHVHLMLAHCAFAALAAATDQGHSQPISAPLDGQIALTAHNNGDGTWSVKRGPTGPVLRDGLPRDKALAIVGGATGPYEPSTDQEAAVAAERAAIEAAEAEREKTELFQSDKEAGVEPAKVARQTDAALAEENARLTAEVAGLRAQLDAAGIVSDAPPEADPAAELQKQTVAELKAYALEAGIDLGDATKKDDIIAAIVAAQSVGAADEPDGVEGKVHNGQG